MKVFLLIIVLITFTPKLNSQVPEDSLNTGFRVKKGIITLKNGNSYFFSDLRFSTDSVRYLTAEKNPYSCLADEVWQIKKNSRSTVPGALIGGGAGLFFGVSMMKALEGLIEVFSFGYYIKNEDKAERTQFIVFSTLIGAGLGSLCGMLIPNNKVIYSGAVESISFQPLIVTDNNQVPYVGMNIRINLR